MYKQVQILNCRSFIITVIFLFKKISYCCSITVFPISPSFFSPGLFTPSPVIFLTSEIKPWLNIHALHYSYLYFKYSSTINNQWTYFYHRDNILYLSARVTWKLSMSKQVDSRYEQFNRYSWSFITEL